MSSISVDELKKQPAEQWLKSSDKSELIVTAHGQPVALLLPVDSQSLQSTLVAWRSARALIAQTQLQEDARKKGTHALTPAEIDAEIAAVRQNRREK